jgi:hypothetical protein
MLGSFLPPAPTPSHHKFMENKKLVLDHGSEDWELQDRVAASSNLSDVSVRKTSHW